MKYFQSFNSFVKKTEKPVLAEGKEKAVEELAVNEDKFDGIADLTKALHFETDSKKAEEMKIELGKRQGEVTRRKQIEGGEYSLRRFRKEIKYGDGKDLGVFLPGSYAAATSSLGDGPHTKRAPKVRWNQKKYAKWLEDVASNDGWKNAFDMAQNAKHEPGLLDWAKKQFRGEDVMQRIQWDIEAFAESVVTNENRELMKIDSYLNTKDEDVLVTFLDDYFYNSADKKARKEWDAARDGLGYSDLVDYAVKHADDHGMDLQDMEDAIEVYETKKVNEAKFVKEFDKAVLDAETEKDVLKVYPKAQFYVGKMSHFFGELEPNLFFKAYYAKYYKEDTGNKIKGDFKITSVYSEKGSRYVNLYLEESVVTEAKGGQIMSGDYVKTQYGDVYLRVDGKVGKSDAYVRVIKGKAGKRKTGLHDSMKLTLVNKDGLEESVNEGISVSDERHFGKKGIIIMIDDNGKKVSAIFKDKKNADKFNRNKSSDIQKLLQLAKKTKYPKAIDESLNEDNTLTNKWEKEEAEFKRIIAASDKRVYDLVDYVQFSTGGMTEKDWEKFMYGRYKKNLQSTDLKTKEKMYSVLQKMVLESEMISESATEILSKDIQDAEYYIAHGDGTSIEARSTKKTWDDGVPVLKYIARGKKQMVKTPKGSFELVVDKKYGWYYWENNGTWYGANIEYGATPPFEF
jgi:hypothetical protein